MDSPQNNQTLFLSRYRSLTVIKTEHTVVAKITNTSTGQVMTLSKAAVEKLMAAMSFVYDERNAMLTDDERHKLQEEDIRTPKLPVKRKLTFVDSDSPIIIDESPNSSPEIPPSQMHMGYYEEILDEDVDSDHCEELGEMRF